VVKSAFSCVMMSLLISNSLHVSVRPSRLVNDISVIPFVSIVRLIMISLCRFWIYLQTFDKAGKAQQGETLYDQGILKGEVSLYH